ncbi:transmembrane signal receptor [Lithospermum erythrorhizon]|uniref:Transmembrane signal receptor n=1 Tax=Lithospermum erythrorhizon TaxID=34254 RepID=A0AAV3PSR3_LITER
MRISGRALFIFFTLLYMEGLEICCGEANSTITCLAGEGEALLELKGSFVDDSHRLQSWTGEDCCSWKGVECNRETGHVVKLDLHNPVIIDYDRFNYDPEYAANYSRSCLGGEVSPSLLNLTRLLYLDLSSNNFSSAEIPSFMGSLKSLRYLKLSLARFGGNVTPYLGNLSSLDYLDLSDFWTNALTSDSLSWISSLQSLNYLNLSGVNLAQSDDWMYGINMLPSLIELNLSNCLVGRIPPLQHYNFTSLVSLDLQQNLINSTVPPWISNITGLLKLRLDGNGFYGSIPDTFMKLTSLRELGLSSNFFEGSFPSPVFSMVNLSYLDLYSNRFSGSIPSNITSLCSLELINLSTNKFSGEIPDLGTDPFGCLTNLQHLQLSYNSFMGPIPESFGMLSSLLELDISNNLLTGIIPANLGQLRKLKTLYLNKNSLSGMISELHFAQLAMLSELYMSSNSLVFNVSSQWVPPFQLQTIRLDSCVLGPDFPLWLRTQTKVEDLGISNASISDILPDWFEQIYSHVHFLDLSRNRISGKLPKFEESNLTDRRLVFRSNNFVGPLIPLPSDVYFFDVSDNSLEGNISIPEPTNLTVQFLLLSNNFFTGEIPTSLCQIKVLWILDISSNLLTGRIPDCFGDIQSLSMLDLSDNNLNGAIPSSLSSLTTLSSLRLHNNSFEGKLPLLQDWISLTILDLGRNDLNDVIPTWIGENLTSLRFLNLQSNKLHGNIPPSICLLEQLQLLNLVGNDISGKIPLCFGNLTGMNVDHYDYEYLFVDIDYGGSISEIIKGIERRYTKTLPFLVSIDLSNNNITGQIPGELMNLSKLLNLNMSRNHLQGRLPEKIGDLGALESLDLSWNDLSGPVPYSLSSLTYLSHLNLSYNNFSGRVPTGNQLQTLNDPSIYIGNNELCGAPLPNACPGDVPLPKIDEDTDDNEDNHDRVWFFTGMGPGFLVGWLGVCSVLYFKKSWNYAYFHFLENIFDKIKH